MFTVLSETFDIFGRGKKEEGRSNTLLGVLTLTQVEVSVRHHKRMIVRDNCVLWRTGSLKLDEQRRTDWHFFVISASSLTEHRLTHTK